MRLERLDYLPEELASIGPREIMSVFRAPTLISVPGARQAQPLFLSTLLHGNETTSFYVLQALARRYRTQAPPRPMLIFVGNVEATAAGVRFLPGQPDFNRIWKADGEAHALAEEVADEARAAGVFASIDIHNNTGDNPHYGCVASLRPADLHLAAMFAPIGVLYQIPDTTQSVAFSRLCPALTVECGRSGDAAGIERAINLVEGALALEHLPERAPPKDALRMYHTVGRVVIDPDCSFSFGPSDADLILPPDLEAHNFVELEQGALWAEFRGARLPLRVVDEHNDDLTAKFLQVRGQRAMLTHAMTPAMVTQNEIAIRQDCLCYLMTPLLHAA